MTKYILHCPDCHSSDMTELEEIGADGSHLRGCNVCGKVTEERECEEVQGEAWGRA